MELPIGILIGLGSKILKATGVIGKGKMTVAGVSTIVAGGIAAGITGESINPFDAAIKIVELAKEAWPHVVILFGALTTLAGYFRKAGAAGSK